MAYSFIIGSNPLHPEQERKEYIICIRPHFALISVDKTRVKHLRVERLQLNERTQTTVSFTLESKLLKAAAHWYKRAKTV